MKLTDALSLNRILDKIERPTRSGLEGAIVAVMLLQGVLLSGVSGGDPSVCDVLFWKCPTVVSADSGDKYRWRELHVQIVAPGKGNGKSHVCMERYRSSYKWDGDVHTYEDTTIAPFLEDCDGWHDSSWQPCPVQIEEYPVTTCLYQIQFYWSDERGDRP